MMNPYYSNQPNAQMYNQMPQPNYTQPLSPEEIAMLMKGTKSSWTMALTPEEKLRAICTHKDPNKGNQFSIVPLNNGYANAYRCYICGEELTLREYSKEDTMAATEEVINILQNVKTTYLDMPPGVAADYFILIPLLRKLPELLEIAKNNFAKYDSSLHNPMYGTGNTFAALGTLLNPAMGMNMGYQNPAAMGYQNPAMNSYPNPAAMGYQNPAAMGAQQPAMDPAQMQAMMAMMSQMQQQQTAQPTGANPFFENGQTPNANQQQQPAPNAQPYNPTPADTAASTTKLFK